jgi:chemotaxis-related protein WspD
LLDRALPVDYRGQWTAHFAQEKKLAAPNKRSVVVFLIGKEWLALPTHVFQEVAERRRIHSLPHRRQGVVLGLTNVRGELLICVSLGCLLGLQSLESGATSANLPSTHSPAHPLTFGPHSALRAPNSLGRLLVVNLNGHRFAFPVDEVQGIHRFEPEHLRAPPATLTQASPNFTQGVFRWLDRSIGVLDAEALFATFNRSLS